MTARTLGVELPDGARPKTHCLRGHPYDEANTYQGRGWRECRACHRIKDARLRARRRLEREALASLTPRDPAAAIAARFWPKVRVTGFCWEWLRPLDRDGYGRFSVGTKTVKAHRWAYQNLVGPIPPDLPLDHLCRNRSCVNPDHLEIVTPAENVRRSRSPFGVNAGQTHCLRGHLFDEANTYMNGDRRICRECRKIHMARYRASRRAKAQS